MNRNRLHNSVPITSAVQPILLALKGVLALARRLWLISLLVTGAFAWFLVASGGAFSETSRTVLHGLCAQRPTHSFTVGGELLPFDARMTGIYSGALASWIVLLGRHRLVAKVTPSIPVIAVLAGAVLLLAIDGFNALLVDLGRWHPYEPRNAVRFFTGFGTGVALASLQSWLIGTALWKLGRAVAVWRSTRDVLWVVPVSALAYLGVLIAPGWSYPLLAFFLMASAWITVTGLVLVIVVSALRLETQITSLARIHVPLAASAAVALGVILGLAQGRFWLERTLGIPQDFVAVAPETVGTILLVLKWPFG